MNNTFSTPLKYLKKLSIGLLPVFVVYAFFRVLRWNEFGSWTSIYVYLQQSMQYLAMGLGLLCIQSLGLWDFTPGAIVLLTALLGGVAYQHFGMAGLVVGCVLSGLIIGCINGFFFTRLKLPSVVITIALALIYEAIGTKMASAGVMVPPADQFFGRAPGIFIMPGIALVIMYFIYNKTSFGFHVRALGSDQIISMSAGINERRVKFSAFAIAGTLYGIAGLICLSYGSAVVPVKNLQTMGTTFKAMMGGFIALYISGQINRVIGVLVGVFTINILAAGLIAINVPGTWQQVIIGIFLLIFIGFSETKKAFNEASGRKKRNREIAALKQRD